MKLRTKVCPNNCLDPESKSGKQYKRMIITSSIVDNTKPIGATRTLIDWHCPICDTTLPVSANDITRSSRHPVSDIAAGHRGSYGLTGAEQK